MDEIITLLATIFENLLIEFIDGIPGVCVFEPDFIAGNLTVNDTQAADPKPVESFKRALQSFDVAPAFGQSTQSQPNSVFGSRRESAKPCGDLI